MKTPESQGERRQSWILRFVEFLKSGVWGEQKSSKVTLILDRRLSLAIVVVAVYGSIRLVGDFDGLDVVVVPDTVDSSSRWPNAGGRLKLGSYEWWGLKRAKFLVEPRFFVDEDIPELGKQYKWMIINGTGPQKDQSGGERFPRPLFVDGYVGPDDFRTLMTILDRDLRWFDFGAIKEESPKASSTK